MTILDYMMNALSVRELHEIPGVLMDVLLDHNKLERLIANMSGCYSYSGLLQEFEEKAADRKNYMQDYTPQSVMDIVAGISTNGYKTYGGIVPYGCRNSGINSYDVYIYKWYKVKRTNGCAFLVQKRR